MLDRFLRVLRQRAQKKLQRVYRDSSVRFIYPSHLGINVYVHPQKLVGILESDESCDAEGWMRAMAPVMNRGGVMLDVGANIGIVSCWLAQFADTVFAFEPDKQNTEMLNSNVELNGVANVTLVQSAVGAYDGEADFYQRNSFGHHSTVEGHITKIVEARRVPLLALDTFCAENNVDHVAFLKIDVEGTEIDVLRGCETYLRERRVDMVLFEHAPILLERQKHTEVFDFLTDQGYVVRDMLHNTVGRDEFLSGTQGDYYATPA